MDRARVPTSVVAAGRGSSAHSDWTSRWVTEAVTGCERISQRAREGIEAAGGVRALSVASA